MPEKKVVLCVDDEKSGLTIRKMMFESLGYQVLTALDGPEGIELLAANPVDAVVLDFSMPGMKGDVVARRMRQVKPRVPIVLLTAYMSLPEDVTKLVDAFVTKGQPTTVLLEQVASVVLTSHRHPEWEGDYVAFANADRQYVEVTEGFCKLLGYTRQELQKMRIDDVSAQEDVSHAWQQFVKNGFLEGTHALRDRSGKTIPIRYKAKVFPDGCMVSRMEPLAAVEQPATAIAS